MRETIFGLACVASLVSFVYLCATGEWRTAFGAAGCFAIPFAWVAYEIGHADGYFKAMREAWRHG